MGSQSPVEKEFKNCNRGNLGRDVSGILGVNIRPFFIAEFFVAEQGSSLSIPQQSASMKVKVSDWS